MVRPGLLTGRELVEAAAEEAPTEALPDRGHLVPVPLAVVLAVNGSCSACHVKIRPAAMQILKQGREIVYCDSCKRILYYEPQSS